MLSIKEKCEDNETITFNDRQKGEKCNINAGIWQENKKTYLSNKTLLESGRIFNASEKNTKNENVYNISGRFLPDPLYKKFGKYANPTTPTTYIYIISKVVDGISYYKVGEGGKGESKGNGRLGDAQTFLIPGLEEDAGYKVHYVFFFRKNLHYNSIHIGQHIEKNIHKILKYYFKPTNISYPNGETSEWYLLQESDEETFFLGFVFDIIGCYDHEKTKPIEIWKYSPNTPTKSKVKIPSGISTRMRLDNTYATIESKLKEFNLRKKQRPLGMIIDKNDALRYAEQLNELRKVFGFSVRENIRKKPYKLKFLDQNVLLKDFQTYGSAQLDKYSKYYALMEPAESTTMDDFASFLEDNKMKYEIVDETVYLRLKDFLELYKLYYVSNVKDWVLKPIYDFYMNPGYEKNIEKIASPTQQTPSWFSNRKVQLFWAQKMTNEKEWKYHNDYSMEDEDTTASLKKWEVYGYDEDDGVRVKRFQLDSNDQAIEDTNEEVNISRIMKIKNVFKPEQMDKKDLKQKYTILNSISVSGKPVKKGDIVEIRDDYFLWVDKYGEPDGLPHNDWRQYKVDIVYRNLRFSEDSMNPMMDVREHPRKTQSQKYEIIANDFLAEKFRKLSSGPSAVEPLFKKDQIVFIAKLGAKHIFDDKKWHENDHYVMIESLDKKNNSYNIRLFAPFTTTESVSMTTLHKYGKIKDSNSANLTKYKEDLLFKIIPVEQIDDHKPKNATSHMDLIKPGRRNPQYKVTYQDGNAENMGISTLQNAKIVEKNASSKVSRYWRTLRRNRSSGSMNSSKRRRTIKKKPLKSHLYDFETFDENLDRAKQNWIDHHNYNVRQTKNKKSAYEKIIYMPDGTNSPFRVGDLFITGGKNPKKGYLVNYFYKRKMTYGVFFSSSDNDATGKEYPEYDNEGLMNLIKEGNTIEFLNNLDTKVFGKMKRRYEAMIANM